MALKQSKQYGSGRIITVVLLAVLMLPLTKSYACSCFGLKAISPFEYNSHDLIFIGTLIAEREGDSRYDKRIATYRVLKAYKGTNIGDSVEVGDRQYESSCGLGQLYTGRDYLVFAYGDTTYYTNRCTRTVHLPLQISATDTQNVKRFRADTLFLNNHITTTSLKGAEVLQQ